MPSSPQTAAAARVSIGAGATRWLMIVWVTTTSQPSNRSGLSADASPQSPATFVPAASNSRLVVGGVEAEHGGQRVVVDLDQLDRVLALVGMLGDDDGDRLADEPDLVGGQQALGHLGVHQAGRRRRDERQVGQVGAGERGDHAGRRQRRADVDRC